MPSNTAPSRAPGAAPARRTGGRSAAVLTSIKHAVEELIEERGRERVTIPMVAERAGVNPTSIYRRWGDLPTMINDIATYRLGGGRPVPDTGDLRADLLTGIGTVAAGLGDPVLGRVLIPFVADLGAHPELREAFFDQVFHVRRATTGATLRAAMARGEVRDDVDLEFLLDVLAAPAYFRQLYGHAPVDRRLVEQTVDLVLAAIATPGR